MVWEELAGAELAKSEGDWLRLDVDVAQESRNMDTASNSRQAVDLDDRTYFSPRRKQKASSTSSKGYILPLYPSSPQLIS